MRTIEFKMERQGLVNKGDKVKIIEREGTSSYSYIIDPAVAMSGCFAARYRINCKRHPRKFPGILCDSRF